MQLANGHASVEVRDAKTVLAGYIICQLDILLIHIYVSALAEAASLSSELCMRTKQLRQVPMRHISTNSTFVISVQKSFELS